MTVSKIIYLTLFLSGLILISCQEQSQTVNAQKFGGEVTLDESVSLADIYASPDQFIDKEIRIEGTIKQVCQHKGCWIILSESDKELIVRFKDYGFFVPKDAATSKVIVQGIFSMQPDKHVEEESKAQKEGKDHVEGSERAVLEEHARGKDNDEKMENDQKSDKPSPYSFTASAVLIYSEPEKKSS